jgi:peptidyl-prolyl cis-trans isomerase SurA
MRSRCLAATAAAAGLIACLAGAAASGTEQLVDGIAAQVGSRVVLISEVMRIAGPQEAAMRRQGAPEQEIAKLRAEALEGLIEARLIEGVVAQLELYAKDEEIDATIAAIAKENGLTLEQLYASVVFHGMTRDEYRQQIKHDLERRNAVNSFVGQDVEITDALLRDLYDQRFAQMPASSDHVRVRQILVSYGRQTARDESAACEIVRQARDRVLAGEDFAAVAGEVSEVAPAQGGDIGWLPTADLASWMSDSLDGLEPGGVSEPVLLPFGCSVLELVERRQVERLTFEQARPALEQELWSRGAESKYREWIEELRERTYIDRRGHFADAARFGEPTFGVAPIPAPEP